MTQATGAGEPTREGEPERSAARSGGGAIKQVRVLTHGRPDHTAAGLRVLIDNARKRGAILRFDVEEAEKHHLRDADGIVVGPVSADEVDLCLVLGGDGTILKALRLHADVPVPVFAINYGEIGFLAAAEPAELQAGVERALSGDFELLHLPMIVLEGDALHQRAVNDIAIHRKIGDRVASLSYSFGDQELGSVRCDGLVVATPAGSTGYNLANGGPVMAWGVAGFVVSFIAPHSLTARALVVAPHDRMRIYNRGKNPLDVSIDGRPSDELQPDGVLSVAFVHAACTLAQLPGSSFYRRLGEKFGRLAR